MKKLAFLFFLCVGTAAAQDSPFNFQPVLSGSGRPLPGAQISICVHVAVGSPCTNFATVFSDQARTQQINQSTSPIKTDAFGNVPTTYAAPGLYDYTISGAGISTLGPYSITISCTPGVSCAATGANNTFTGNNTFGPGSLTVSGTGTLGTTTVAKMNTEFWVDGVTYTTPQAAMTAANAAGGGIVHVPCGTFVGPTTFYSSVAVVSSCPFEYNMVNPLSGQASPPVLGTFFTYSASLSLASISNSKIDGITFDFQNSGFGIVIGNSYVSNQWPNVAVVRCGNSTTDCIAWQTSGSVNTGNSAFNDFGNLYILTNQTTNNQANCMTMNGSGPVNAGAFPTNNWFNNTVCTGGTRNGLIFRLNSDTNYFKRAFIVTLSQVASTGCIVLNDVTPASDQDTDGGTIDNLVCVGFPSVFRAGQTSGWYVRVAGSGGFPSMVNLGGTPLLRVDLIGLGSAVNPDVMVGGRISANGASGVGPSTSSVAGDITSARSATSGSLWMGTDGNGSFSRTSNTMSVLVPATGVFQLAQGAFTSNFQIQGANLTYTLPASSATFAVTVASGTSTMVSGSVAAATCAAAVTTTATNTTTSDSIEWAYATAPTLTTDALLNISPYVTSGNVNFTRCNPTAGAIVGTAIVINWRVIR